jgi:RimJ/RimL family protein N-acetyltransferase
VTQQPTGVRTDDGDVIRRVSLGARELVVRRPRPSDRAPLAELFESLSFDDRYLRFFSAFRPDERFVDRLIAANDNGACEVLAVMTDQDGWPHVVGEAGAWPLDNGNGELGITVVRDHRGWLGPYLLDALLDLAAANGIPNLEADVMTTNRRMLTLLRERGMAVVGHDGFTSIRLLISTAGTTPTWAPKDGRPRVLVEAAGGRWNAEEAKRRLPLQVISCPGPNARTRRRPCPALSGRPCPLAADADAIVVQLDDEGRGSELIAAHRSLHAGVPVCVQGHDDDRHSVELVDRVGQMARDHAGE